MLTPEQIAGIEKFQRYLDPDGDGIPYRTLPGISPKASYFTRGSGHSRFGAYTEDSAEYQDVLDRLTRKFKTAAQHVPAAVADGRGSAAAIVTSGPATRRFARRLLRFASPESRSTTCACAGFPSAPRSRNSWRRTRPSSSSNRIAMRSCARC
jgi:2-oxoglutarate ferredoxin oxidoreductase subunit alpha